VARNIQDRTPVQSDRLEEIRARYTRPSFLVQLALLALLAALPFVIPSFRVMDVVVKIMIFTVVVASFDLILGYTGILSFAHGMFFGLGAYSMALITYHSGTPQWYHFPLAVLLTLFLSVAVALLISFFSLRIKAIFFAFMTLALAEFGHILGYQWSGLTMGEDGISFKMPGIFDVNWSGGTFLGTDLNGRLVTYYLILAVSVLLFLGLVRFVRSPLGRVLKAIRANEPRAVALGYKTFHYQTFSIVFGSSVSALAGVLFAMWLRYVNPDSVLGTALMLNILLMCVIGGLGTLYGGIIGAAFITVTQAWLPDLQKATVALFPHAEIIHRLAERWILYFGILFILVVFFFPKGIIGTIRDSARQRRRAALSKD